VSGAPQLAELYKTSLSAAKNVELLHLNLDSDDGSMAGFMTKGGFTFPGMTEAKWKKIKMFEELAPSGVPGYKLVDASGKVIAEGGAAKEKAKELAGGTATKSE
jgi:hypothetical protein